VVGFGAMGCGLIALCARSSVIYVNGNGNVTVTKKQSGNEKIQKDKRKQKSPKKAKIN